MLVEVFLLTPPQCLVFTDDADLNLIGIGAVLSGPVSEVLLNHGGFDIDGLKVGYGSKYGAMIVFTGVTAACGIVCFGARWRKS